MIIDTTDDTSGQIVHLQANNTTTVIRYLTSTLGSDKLVTPREARALAAAGIWLALVFEVYGGADDVNDINDFYGSLDARFCLDYVPTLGAPADGSVCIYFACDTDFSAIEIQQKVLPYFMAIAKVFAVAGSPYLIGVYGSGDVCDAVCSAGFAKYAWLSCSMGWGGSRAYLKARLIPLVLVQHMGTRIANLDADTNLAFGAFGNFLPFAEADRQQVPVFADI